MKGRCKTAVCLAASSLTWALALAAESPLPEGEGKELVQRMCRNCHTIEVVTAARLSKARWAVVVEDMRVRGAKGTDEEADIVTEYLAKHFGRNRPRDGGEPPPKN
jgi:cytochrome c5